MVQTAASSYHKHDENIRQTRHNARLTKSKFTITASEGRRFIPLLNNAFSNTHYVPSNVRIIYEFRKWCRTKRPWPVLTEPLPGRTKETKSEWPASAIFHADNWNHHGSGQFVTTVWWLTVRDRGKRKHAEDSWRLDCRSATSVPTGRTWPSQPFYAARHMILELTNARRRNIYTHTNMI